MAPVVAPVVAIAGGAGYLASKYNQSNLEKQAPIQQKIDDLTQKKSAVEERLEHAVNSRARYRCRRQLKEIESQILAAKEELKAFESMSITKMAAGAYDSVYRAVGQSVQNITNAYTEKGAFYAAQEVAKHVDTIPGITGYPKAAVKLMAGNVTHGLTEAAVHTITGGTISLSDKLVDSLTKTNAKELMEGVVVPVIMKEAEGIKAQVISTYS